MQSAKVKVQQIALMDIYKSKELSTIPVLYFAFLSKVKTPIGEKDVIPTDTTSLIPFTSEEEAHYVCAILNSSPVGFCVRSYSSAGRGFGAPSIVKHFGIPKYVKGNGSHQEISELSKRAHGLAK